MDTKNLPILTVVEVNSLPRFVIQDEKERVWNGERFGPDGGRLFARHNDAATAAQDILRSSFVGVQSVKYVVPLFVEVLSHDPVVVSDVAQYLSNSARLYINTPEHGNGPGNSLVLPRIEWHRIEQMKEFPVD